MNAVQLTGEVYHVSGTVLDANTNNGVAGAQVRIMNASNNNELVQCNTDETGSFRGSFNRSAPKKDNPYQGPSLYFVVDVNGQQVQNTKNEPIRNAGMNTPPILVSVSLPASSDTQMVQSATPLDGWELIAAGSGLFTLGQNGNIAVRHFPAGGVYQLTPGSTTWECMSSTAYYALYGSTSGGKDILYAYGIHESGSLKGISVYEDGDWTSLGGEAYGQFQAWEERIVGLDNNSNNVVLLDRSKSNPEWVSLELQAYAALINQAGIFALTEKGLEEWSDGDWGIINPGPVQSFTVVGNVKYLSVQDADFTIYRQSDQSPDQWERFATGGYILASVGDVLYKRDYAGKISRWVNPLGAPNPHWEQVGPDTLPVGNFEGAPSGAYVQVGTSIYGLKPQS